VLYRSTVAKSRRGKSASRRGRTNPREESLCSKSTRAGHNAARSHLNFHNVLEQSLLTIVCASTPKQTYAAFFDFADSPILTFGSTYRPTKNCKNKNRYDPYMRNAAILLFLPIMHVSSVL